jgi:hypothetical protein
MLEVEAIGDGVARGPPLRHLVVQPQTMKVFEQSLQSLRHLDGNEGDDLLGKTVPSTTDSLPLHRLHGYALREGGTEVEGKLMQVSMRLNIVPGCLCVFLGAADVVKSRSKGLFGS